MSKLLGYAFVAVIFLIRVTFKYFVYLMTIVRVLLIFVEFARIPVVIRFVITGP